MSKKSISINPEGVTNKYVVSPSNPNRIFEGGLRTKGTYKHSLPSKPLLSIVTVVYNRVKNIDRCIRSVLEQDYDNVEYIVIDACSVDGTLDIIKKYDNAIDYIISEPDEGIYDAMNKGIALASGDYINFMNSDDYFKPNVLSLYADKVKEGVMIIAAKSDYVNEENTLEYIYDNTFELCVGRHISHQLIFMSSQAFDKIGNFGNEYTLAEDNKIVLKTIVHYGYDSFVHIDNITTVCSLMGVSNTSGELGQEELHKLHWDLYGRPLGLDYNFYLMLLGEDNEYIEGNVSQEQWRLHVSENHAQLKESMDIQHSQFLLRLLLLKIYYTQQTAFLKRQAYFRNVNDIMQTYENRQCNNNIQCDNIWCRFGQLSNIAKCKKVFFIIMKLPFLIIKFVYKKTVTKKTR